MQKIEQTQAFLDSLEVLLPTLESFRKSAQIQLELRKKGKTIDPVDVFIAGIATVHQQALCTKNTRQFAEVPDLKIVSY